MIATIPHDRWNPLSVERVRNLFANAPFAWALAGGYAVEQFLGRTLREHGDIDVAVYRDEQAEIYRWLEDWQLYAATSGTLRKWNPGEYLPYGIHDIWGHKSGSQAWQMQLMLQEVEEEQWFSRRSRLIRGRRDDLICEYNTTPCVRIEVQLMYKAKDPRPKDEIDLRACLPQMSRDAKMWLKDSLMTLYPDGHRWVELLDGLST